MTEYWYKYSALFEQAWAEWVEHDKKARRCLHWMTPF